ncbi:hypothetical protein D3C86_2264170 [compost metagenome]
MVSGFAGGRIYDIWGGATLYRFASVTAVVACIGFIATHLLQQEAGDGEITLSSKGESS